LGTPVPVAGKTIISVALPGVVINTATALLFLSGHKSDLNIKGEFLHIASNAGVSAGVVIVGVHISFRRTGNSDFFGIVVDAVQDCMGLPFHYG
jgi:Co/Zn/Cd efflux system component